MIKSKLPNNVLGKIWKLSDVDKDGMLDAHEFALSMHLINIKLDGEILNELLTFEYLKCFSFFRTWFAFWASSSFSATSQERILETVIL